MTLLSVQNIAAHYAQSQALFDVSFDLAEGECLAMMGRNGMGKSTTAKTICRLLPISGGQITLDGKDTRALPAYRLARRGVGLVPEGRRVFAPLTVRENLTAAARPGAYGMGYVTDLFPRLAERAGQTAMTLSGGEQQMLAIGRALMTQPRLLVLDEATEGLAPVLRAEIWEAIARLKAETGLAILVIDKSLAELSRVADRVVILERGRSVWTGALAELSADIQTQLLGV